MRGREFFKSLYDHARSLDGGRLINYVSNSIYVNPALDAAGVGDVIMFNEYFGTWTPLPPPTLPLYLSLIHAAYPNKPMIVAEYGLCEPFHKGGDPRRIKDMREHTAHFADKPYVAGAIYFSLNDYRTQMGEEGQGRYRRRVHGVTDLYGEPKPSYQALRELASPIEVVVDHKAENGAFDMTVRAKDTLPSYAVVGYKLAFSGRENKELNSLSDLVGPLPDLQPGQEVGISFDGHEDRPAIHVYNPEGYLVYSKNLDH